MGHSWLESEAVEALKNVEESRRVREEDGQFLLSLDHDFIQEIKDQATAEALVEKMFGISKE